MKKLTLGAALACAAFGLFACKGAESSEQPIPPADRQEIEGLLAAAQERADALRAARDKALKEAFSGPSIDPNAPPCAVKVPVPPALPDEGTPLSEQDKAALDAARWRMNVVPAWALLGEEPKMPLKGIQKLDAQRAKKGPRADQFERQFDMLKRLLSDGKYIEHWKREDMVKLGRELASDDYWGWELDIVAAVREDPTFDGSETFKTGLIAGRAFLWSFPEGRVVCAGAVLAQNQDRIKLLVNTNDRGERQHQRLNDDLANEAYRAALAALRQVK